MESWATSHSESVSRKGIESVVLRCDKLLKGQVDEEGNKVLSDSAVLDIFLLGQDDQESRILRHKSSL